MELEEPVRYSRSMQVVFIQAKREVIFERERKNPTRQQRNTPLRVLSPTLLEVLVRNFK